MIETFVPQVTLAVLELTKPSETFWIDLFNLFAWIECFLQVDFHLMLFDLLFPLFSTLFLRLELLLPRLDLLRCELGDLLLSPFLESQVARR